MPLLNIPIGISPIDDFVLRNIPKQSKAGVIVNSGTDRLSKAVKDTLGTAVSVYNIEPRLPLYSLLSDDGLKAKDPWDLDWYTRVAEKHEGLDFIFFLNIHEFWHGDLLPLQKILKLLKPEGRGFISFYNKNSLYEIRQDIPPFSVGLEQLVDPMKNWAKLDLGSWMVYLTDIGYPPTCIWGMLEEEAFKYCREAIAKEVIWKTKGLDVKVRDPSEAYTFGAPVMCIQFQEFSATTPKIPQFFGVQYNASMLQAILFPYLGILPSKLDAFSAYLDTDNYAETKNGSLVLLNFFIAQLKDFQDIKKVLVVGCNWGVDLLSLKKIKPDWEITGVDASKEIVSAGTKLMKSQGIDTLTYDDDGHLSFPDESFDLVISFKHFSHIYQPLAERLANEMVRVSKYGIVQLEDFRGPELSMQMKLYSIPDIYLKLGQEIEVRSIKIDEKHSGLYIIKVKK